MSFRILDLEVIYCSHRGLPTTARLTARRCPQGSLQSSVCGNDAAVARYCLCQALYHGMVSVSKYINLLVQQHQACLLLRCMQRAWVWGKNSTTRRFKASRSPISVAFQPESCGKEAKTFQQGLPQPPRTHTTPNPPSAPPAGVTKNKPAISKSNSSKTHPYLVHFWPRIKCPSLEKV